MARIRTIKPEFPQSESMGRISRDARLLFIQLWTICDDEGRTRAASRMLASLLFPYDDDAPKLIDTWINELERERCIIRYQHDGQTYMQICNWLNHQKIDKPSKSKIAPFDEDSITLANPRECSSEDQGSRIKDQGSDSTSEQSSNAPKKKHGSEEDHKAARWMFERVKTVAPTAKEPNWDGWANDIRLMRESDKRDHAAICDLFAWANKDQFWCSNVLSPSKLREKWTQLEAQRSRRPAGPTRASPMNSIGVDDKTPEGFSDGFH